MNHKLKLSKRKIIYYILLLFFIINVVVICTKSHEEKSTYKEDVDRQFKKMYEYEIKPLSGTKMDRLGGGYSAEIKYGNLTEEEMSLLIYELKSDGFRDPFSVDNRDGKHFCKDKIAVAIVVNKDSGKVKILVRQNDYDK